MPGAMWHPVRNYTLGGVVRPPRGQVVHIAEGSAAPAIRWADNPASQESEYFVVGRGGAVTQLVGLEHMAWTQAQGNPEWIGVESEGYATGPLTDAQLDAHARIFAWLHRRWPDAVPLRVANDPSERGLGWHGMGGAAWGGHLGCPGRLIVAQLPEIVRRATAIVEGAEMDVTQAHQLAEVAAFQEGKVYALTGVKPPNPNFSTSAKHANWRAGYLSGCAECKALGRTPPPEV